MSRNPEDWVRMTEEELQFQLQSGDAGSEDVEHARLELERRHRHDLLEAVKQFSIKKETPSDEIFELRPRVWGMGINLKPLLRYIDNWWRRRVRRNLPPGS